MAYTWLYSIIVSSHLEIAYLEFVEYFKYLLLVLEY